METREVSQSLFVAAESIFPFWYSDKVLSRFLYCLHRVSVHHPVFTSGGISDHALDWSNCAPLEDYGHSDERSFGGHNCLTMRLWKPVWKVLSTWIMAAKVLCESLVAIPRGWCNQC